ncbi:TPA: hypothetical protein ACHTKC_004932, partial [Escherichia coli]
NSIIAESGYGLAGLGMGEVKSVNQYRLTPGFGGFTPVSYENNRVPPYMPLTRHMLVAVSERACHDVGVPSRKPRFFRDQ